MRSEMLNIADMCPSTASLGPGRRFAIWLQGCPFNCKGCLAPDWIPFIVARPVAVTELAAQIIAATDIQGITLSGGEPMMQAGALAKLLQLVKTGRPELDVILFSGFTRRQLIWDEALVLLGCIDLLIDGLYVADKNDQIGLRGSGNQQFHFLTDKLLNSHDQMLNYRPALEFHIRNDGVLMTGIPSRDFKW